jgi:hypothetical protein
VEETVTLIDGEWISITPDGFFNASPRGDRFLNVRINNMVYGIDSFRHIFYNPEVVEARLRGLPDPDSKSNLSLQQLAREAPPPVVSIQSPANFSTTNTRIINLSVTVTSQIQPIKTIRVFVNGFPVGRNDLAAIKGEGFQLEQTSITVTGERRVVNFDLPVPLEPGRNLIEIVAHNGFTESERSRHPIEVTWNTPKRHRQPLPNLWILAIGVNQYVNAETPLFGDIDEHRYMPNLNFAVADARAFVNSFKVQEGRRYAKVNSLIIADGEALLPTTENIRRNLTFFDRAGNRDIVILFLAGHGVSAQGGEFFFLPRDAIAVRSAGIWRVDENIAISGNEITAVLAGQGRRLLVIDACHSGGVDSNNMTRFMMESNAFVFTSSQGNELSYESPQFGHGYFTYSILSALRGEPAALTEESNVTVLSMSGFVRNDVSGRVLQRYGHRQNPRLHSLLSSDFPLAVIR